MKLSQSFQAGLFVVLIVTLVINVSFIIETNKRLKVDHVGDNGKHFYFKKKSINYKLRC